MHLHRETVHDATAAEVFAMLANPEFRRTAAVAPGDDGHDGAAGDDGAVEVEVRPAHAEGMTVRVVLPGSVRTEDWVDARHATFVVETPAEQASVTGTRTLVETAGRTTETMVAEITVTGAPDESLEQTTADLLARDLEQEQAAGAAWLAR